VARFDAFDSGAPDAAHASFRTLHDLPAGTEVVQSYCPLGWTYAERQAHCAEVYGFACACPRCLTEAQFSDEEDEEGGWETDEEMASASGEEGGAEAEDAGAGAGPSGDGAAEGAPGAPLEPAYLHLFLLKYVCPAGECGGTMAATPGGGACVCSVCGTVRSDAQFLADLEAE